MEKLSLDIIRSRKIISSYNFRTSIYLLRLFEVRKLSHQNVGRWEEIISSSKNYLFAAADDVAQKENFTPWKVSPHFQTDNSSVPHTCPSGLERQLRAPAEEPLGGGWGGTGSEGEKERERKEEEKLREPWQAPEPEGGQERKLRRCPKLSFV